MHRILCLIWKNLILRKRHWIVTTLEILLPVLFVLILAFYKSKGGSERSRTTVSTPTIFPEKTEKVLTEKTASELFCSDCFVAYAPENIQTTKTIENLVKCLAISSSNVSKPFESEEAIEHYVASISSNDILRNNFRVAIVFEEGLGVGSGSSGTISYKIRQSSRADKPPPVDFYLLFPKNAERYVELGFIGLQVCLDKAVVETVTGTPVPSNTISLQAFPYPPYQATRNFDEIYFDYLPIVIIYGFIFMVPSIMRGVVSEKETGIRELLKLNGVYGWMQWLGWMLNSLIILILSVTFTVIILFANLGGGGIFMYSDPSLWWIVLVLYAIAATSFCFFICSFFTKSFSAITVGIVLWFVTFEFPHDYLLEHYDTTSLVEKLGFALLPNMALDLAIRIISSFEAKAAGIQWSNIAEPTDTETSLTLIHILVMFFVDTFIYMFLTIYLENVLPSEFGVRKPFYYIFLPETYCKRKVPAEKDNNNNNKVVFSSEQDNDKSINGESTEFEDEPNDAQVGVDIRNLQKNFGGHKVAVDGVSMKMYDGEIFALLGHNGAGKTTVISMLTGMFAPSGGTALVNGYDITKNLIKSRKYVGLCPQHNMLFDKLTVLEHLEFFGEIKGLSVVAASFEAKQLLEKLKFLDMKDTLAKKLSGGQQRKLSLGIALIGCTKVVILDEPTSGMDPEARRFVWDLLLEMRGHRTILLTTHFMEEADVLGDRIGIMVAGKLVVCGSPMFLKKFYGTGYTLKLTMSEAANKDKILPIILSFVPDASVKSSHTTTATELNLTLPLETATTSVLSEMFTSLSNQKEKLGIKTVGLSRTTMDEVFLKVGERLDDPQHLATEIKKQSDDKKDEENAANKVVDGKSTTEERVKELKVEERVDDDQKAKSDDNKDEEIAANKVVDGKRVNEERVKGLKIEERTDDAHRLAIEETKQKDDKVEENSPHKVVDSKISNQERVTGLKLAISQFLGLIVKKYIYTYRNLKLMIPQLVLPVILIAIAIMSCTTYVEDPEPVSPLQMDLDSYENDLVTLASSSDPKISSDTLAAVIGYSYEQVPSGKSLSEALLDVADSNLAEYRDNYIVGLEASSSSSIKAIFNTIPNHAAPLAINLASNLYLNRFRKDLKIKVTSHPLATNVNAYLAEANPNPKFSIQIPLMFGVFMPIGLGLLAASFIVFPIEEKACKVKQLQMLTGLSPVTYWYSMFLCDFILVFFVSCLMTLCFPIFQSDGFFISDVGTGTAFLILLVYSFTAIWFSYLFSFFVVTVGGGFSLVAIIHVASGVILSISVYLMELAGRNYQLTTDILRWIGRLFPTFSASLATMRFTELASNNGRCGVLSDEAKNFLCDTAVNVDPAFRQCCANCKQLPGVSCFTPLPYITWSYEKFGYTVPGIGEELVVMIIMAVVYQAVLILLEYHVIQMLLNKKTINTNVEDNIIEDDVKEEAERKVHEDALVVENLAKSYGSFAAVSKLNFGVHHGECFGLLGVNGAGKTTTFKMLTGDTKPSFGNAHAGMKTLENDPHKFLSNIGYCPQFDAIIEVLSGREMLMLFARLRGIPGNMGRVEADKWLERMGLLESADVQCGKYSGGMQRRLSVAIAMIGEPQLLLLDEPTSGVDPVSRRKLWNLLRSLQDSGQSIILTSQSMEECEALCSRLGILINGKLECLGSVQHLKHKFAQGYSLSLKLKPFVPLEESVEYAQLASLKFEISTKFHPCTLIDIHMNVCRYQLHDTSLTWDVLFKTMEELKATYSDIIEDYSLKETTLEDVFFSFSRKQYGNKKTEESWVKRFLKCQCC
ncbi:ATP-binding cassette sub-family A member 3 [Orchesella cincta]|uniref:ATP-binding cassette sub-family A member 3 n=1 Tax=Orchesella cincta TaxID=48709 RepID=A0A1D2N173_ORCCI|nr:ATP-binding cassette sub-family A member 3 [Orchesella cincta]